MSAPRQSRYGWKFQIMGMRTHMDKREGMTPGFKYHDWEMRGIPLRIELGPRDLKENVAVFAKDEHDTQEKIPFKYAAETAKKTLDVNLEMLSQAGLKIENMRDVA